MTPEHREAYDLVGELIARSRDAGHFVNLNERDWSRCIDEAEALLAAIRKPSKRRPGTARVCHRRGAAR